MDPQPGGAPFDDPAYLFEPWWPGSRALVFLEHGRLRMQASELADPLEMLPELQALRDRIMVDGVVLDGMLLVLDGIGHPDRALLRARLEGQREAGGRPAYLALDLLYRNARAVTRRPFAERQMLLRELLRPTEWCAVSHGYAGDGSTVAEALGGLGLTAMSARRLDACYRAGPAGDAWLRIPLGASQRASRRPTLTVIRGFGL